MRLHDWLELKCEHSPKLKVAVACAQDEDVLKAVLAAIHKNWIDAILVGDKPKIVDIAQTLNFDLSKVEIIDEPDLINACEQAVKLVSFKHADFLMKGLVDTSILLKAVLNPEFGLRTGKILSHVALLQTTQMERFIGITDGAMNIAPNVESKKGIIDNAIGLFHNLGYDLPKVAILAAIEKVNPKMSATVDAEVLSHLNYDQALVEGPFGLDNAISIEAAKHKGLTSSMAGLADILMCPDIEAGNILYKALSFMAEAQVAALIVGAKCPIVLTSRADSDVSKLYSIALAKIVSAQKMKPIFVLNLGSTSTKVAIFKDKASLESTTLRHSADALSKYPHVLDQIEFRKEAIEVWLKTVNHSFNDFELLCIRGALLKPIASGIYQINQGMVEELKASRLNAHVSAVGIILGDLWAKTFNKQAIFLNAPSTDELAPLARYTGIKGINRRSGFHALNQKQIALEYAHSISKSYSDLNLIVCHMGGGISVGVHHQASVIDVNHALEGEGPMSPERSGALSVRNAIELFKQLNFDENQFYKLIAGNGGLVSHTGISDVKTLFEQSTSEPKINEVLDAMIYQIAKEIGSMATVVEGKVDAILLTGGLAYSTKLIDRLKRRIDWIAPVFVYPGEDEMYALAMGAYRYLEGQEALKEY